MEKWSAQLDKFRINIFLDTNILCYLIDNTYPTLSGFIKALATIPVVSLYSSEYVLSELIEVRKKEDYYQQVVKQSKKDGRYINISSFIKHNKRYDIPHYPYEGPLVKPVVSKMNKEIEKIVKCFGISFDSKFNDNLLEPMKGVCESTKISREDSLVLITSLFRRGIKVSASKVILLTNDDAFEKWCNESKQELNTVLTQKGLSMPFVESIRTLGSMFGENETRRDLRNEGNPKEIAKEFVTKCLLKMFEDSFIGEVTPAKNAPKAPVHTLFVKMKTHSLENRIYTIIIDKDLNFLYCPQKQADFYYKNNSIGDSMVRGERRITLGYVCDLRKGEREIIFQKLNQRGNLVFIHPDSY